MTQFIIANKAHIDAIALVDRYKRPIVQQLKEIGISTDSDLSHETYMYERDAAMRHQLDIGVEQFGFFSYDNWLLNKLNCRCLTAPELFRHRHVVGDIYKTVRLLLREMGQPLVINAKRIRNYPDDMPLTGLQFNILVADVVSNSF